MNITLIKSVRQAYFFDDDIVEDSWENISNFLSEYNEVSCKENAPMFNLWKFKNAGEDTEQGRQYEYNKRTKSSDKTKWSYVPDTIRRCKDNVIGVWGLVLDYDNGITIKKAIKSLTGIEFILYTTYNHTEANNKFRVVIPFSRMMTSLEFKEKEQSIRDTFLYVDDSTFDMSRAFYMHSGPYPKTYRSSGVILTPENFESVPLPEKKEYNGTYDNIVLSDTAIANRKAELLLALQSCRGMHYSSGLTLASICKSVDMTLQDFQLIVNHIKSPDSGLSDVNWQKDLWVNAAPYISNVSRDKFLVAHGGTAMQRKMSIQSIINLGGV